jgi:uncharacterized membrane protein
MNRTVTISAGAAAGVATAVWAVRRRAARRAPLHVRAAVTVNKPAGEVYSFWRDLELLPLFMNHLESVRTTGERTSHWVAKAPAGRAVEWDARIVDDRPNELIAWRSVEGGDVPNDGTVRFAPAPGGRGTEVRVELRYDLPGGKLAATVAKLFGEEPAQQVRDDLRRFKQVLETGEVVRSEGSPEGTRAFRQLTQKPAQPVEVAAR